jgi:hypothetical protein
MANIQEEEATGNFFSHFTYFSSSISIEANQRVARAHSEDQ